MSTQPLPEAILDQVMPSRATLAQVPIDLNPLLVDGDNRIVTTSMPSLSPGLYGLMHFNAWAM